MKHLTTIDFLSHLRRLGIKISVNNNKLLCQAPDGVLTNELRQEIARRKPEIIAFLQQIHQANNSKLPTIEPISRDRDIPLSFSQKRLWFLHQINPNNTAYNIPAVLELTGILNISALAESIQKIVERHEILRTTFITKNGSPLQVISPQVSIEIKKLEVSLTEAQKIIAAEIDSPFDLTIAPLLRVHLLSLGETNNILLINMHHIVSDGWSLQIFLTELLAFYQALITQKPFPLPELQIQYADYAFWQQKYVTETTFKTQLEYWRSQLANLPKLLELPMQKPRPPIQSFRGATSHFHLGKSLTEKLNNLSKDAQVTPFITLLAAFIILIHRYTHEKDIVVGTPTDNRHRPEISSLIGFFVNTLVLRFKLEDHLPFSEFLVQVQQIVLQARTNSDIPFEQVVEALQAERSTSYNPLFQILFVWQNAPLEKLELPNLTLTPQVTEVNTAKFDLIIYISESSSQMSGWWEYNTDLFAPTAIAQITESFQNILKSIVNHPEKPISAMNLLSDAEVNQLLYEWNHTSTKYTSDQFIHQIFETQVTKTPQAIAVIDEQKQFTYEQLNNRANQIAHHLQHQGVKPETLVGICVERSVEMVATILGILKAGAAYLPIDIHNPSDRIAYILEDSQTSLVIGENKSSAKLEKFNNIQLIKYEEIEGENLHNPNSDLKPENLAYVIYTSGSTGVPKGVMISHQAIANHTNWLQKTFPLANTDRVLQKTPFSFDASVWEFYAPLIAGGQLIMARPQGETDCHYLIDIIQKQAITTIQVVPTLLQLLLESGRLESCQTLKRVFCGGEALPTNLYKKFKQISTAELINLYGPTETTIDASFFLCQGEINSATVPIGKPIHNTQMYILDSHRQVTPIGVTGEIYIGGVGLARGYMNNPELTQERFIPNPFSSQPEDRLYKTGDLARYLPNGNIEYLGRIDNQVKIRGFRLELGEIEKQILNFGKDKIFAPKPTSITICNRCVMPSTYPGIKFDGEGVCNYCRAYELNQKYAQNYFQTLDNFHKLMAEAKEKKRSQEYDILLLFSGGKDSSYALYRLVEMGYKVLTFTFDNGYISPGAFRNIQQITTKLNVENIVLTTAQINDIFRESLIKDYSVCSGCFRSLTALSTRLADQKGINVIITGLSRGQIFDTKLQNLFANGIDDVEQIERELLLYRKMYHRRNDTIEKLLNVEIQERAFDEIYFVDFFRYDNTPASQVKRYLQNVDEYWLQPEDTGFCSTNCLANDVGIYIHSQEKGYHNYAVPISWDIRLGASREEGLQELSDEINIARVEKILSNIGYLKSAIANVVVAPKINHLGHEQLIAYIIPTDTPPNPIELRKFLKTKLPDYMIPTAYVMLAAFPLTPNGKIDLKALPVPENIRLLEIEYVSPQNETEKLIAKVWQDVLGLEKVGIYDNFFELGGHSLMMTQVVSQLSEIFAENLSILDLFQEPTINALAKYLNQKQKTHSTMEKQQDRNETRKIGSNTLAQQRQRRAKNRIKD